MSEIPTFVYILTPNRPSLVEDVSPEEELVLDEHFEYLQRALAEGKLVLAGRCLDADFGIVVFRATTEGAAKEFMNDDPAVKSEVMTARLKPFRIALAEKD
jgi:uncharacterized protein YciI